MAFQLHESGDGYAELDAATGEDKLSTDLWASFSRNAVTSFLSHDPCNFLQPIVSSWIHQGMFSAWPYTFAMQLALMLFSQEWAGVWRGMLEESPVGNPPLCDTTSSELLDITDGPKTSSNLVHQVFVRALACAPFSRLAWLAVDRRVTARTHTPVPGRRFCLSLVRRVKLHCLTRSFTFFFFLIA